MKKVVGNSPKAESKELPPVAADATTVGWSPRRRLLVLSALVLLLLAAYANSFRVPFLLDDEAAITGNESIHDLSRLGRVFSPAPSTTVEGRPIANFSLAINYAISGARVEGYHAVNFIIHAGAMLLLFGIVRRTLKSDARFKDWAEWIACGVAGVWALHPIQTESVTYIVQRVESLMGFFYLLTL